MLCGTCLHVTCALLSGEWMIPVNQENLARSSAAAAAAAAASSPAVSSDAPAATGSSQDAERRADDSACLTTAGAVEEKPETPTVPEVKGDPEMAPVFLRQLLPVFTHVFQAAMLQSVRFVDSHVRTVCQLETSLKCSHTIYVI